MHSRLILPQDVDASRASYRNVLAAPSLVLPHRRKVTRKSTMDSGSALTFDRATVDSTGAFLIGELERLDQTLHEPLAVVTWGRDIELRTDVTIADEDSSFTNSSFASPGGVTPSGISWASKLQTAVPSIELDIAKTKQPLTLWNQQVDWTIPELMSAEALGRPVDDQKYQGMKLKHQMDIDQMVYIGDTYVGKPGLINNTSVYQTNVAATGTGSTTQWANKTPAEILADINTALTTVWTNTGYVLPPTDILIPTAQFGLITTQTVSTAGNISILEYVVQNCVSTKANGRPLKIKWLKWAAGAGASGTDRMVAYTNEKRRVRYPMTPLTRTPIENRALWQITTYFCRLGAVEFVYPESLGYFDGI